MADHPAAHSMDTHWFAVDSQGRVGVFDSGEDGAVPLDAATSETVDEERFRIAAFCSALAAGAEIELDEELASGVPSLLVADDVAPFRPLVEEGILEVATS